MGLTSSGESAALSALLMDMEFCSTRKEEVWEEHFHFRDDNGGGDVMMMMAATVVAKTYQMLAPRPMLAAVHSISPP